MKISARSISKRNILRTHQCLIQSCRKGYLKKKVSSSEERSTFREIGNHESKFTEKGNVREMLFEYGAILIQITYTM